MTATGRIEVIDQFMEVLNRYNELSAVGSAFEKMVLSKAMRVLAEEIDCLARMEEPSIEKPTSAAL